MRVACFSARMGQRSGHKRALQSLPRCMGRTERRLDPRTMSAPLWMSCSGHAADLQVALTSCTCFSVAGPATANHDVTNA